METRSTDRGWAEDLSRPIFPTSESKQNYKVTKTNMFIVFNKANSNFLLLSSEREGEIKQESQEWGGHH